MTLHADLYTAGPGSVYKLLFTQFTFQIIVQQTQAVVDIKATTDGGSTFYHIGKTIRDSTS